MDGFEETRDLKMETFEEKVDDMLPMLKLVVGLILVISGFYVSKPDEGNKVKEG